jgi:hypothetical protein
VRLSDEHILLAVRLLAFRLWRAPMMRDWLSHDCQPSAHIIRKRWCRWDRLLAAAGLPVPVIGPAWGQGVGFGRRFWTTERVIAGMRRVREELGYFPLQGRHYNPLKEGRLDWPRADLIRRLGGGGRSAWRIAMVKAGLSKDISGWHNSAWREDDNEYLLENAGLLTLKRIAFHLGRSYAACRRHLYDLGTRARDARGYYTGMLLAEELNVPLGRVYLGIATGRLVAHRPPGRPYWQIDPDSMEAARGWLTAPKRTHSRTPVAPANYRRARGIRRKAMAT